MEKTGPGGREHRPPYPYHPLIKAVPTKSKISSDKVYRPRLGPHYIRRCARLTCASKVWDRNSSAERPPRRVKHDGHHRCHPPVLAGIISRRKFSYDVWGDTVNIASRLQQLAAPDAITISDATRTQLTGAVRSEPLGEVELRGRGRFATFRLARALA